MYFVLVIDVFAEKNISFLKTERRYSKNISSLEFIKPIKKVGITDNNSSLVSNRFTVQKS